MGKIKSVLTTQEIVKNNVDTYIKDSTSEYPSFLESAPYFVNYYSRSAYQSTYDESFEIYNEIAGEESPNKFHRIENLPVYSLDVSDFNSELSEEGWKKEISSSCIILPNTITPMPDDLIEIEIHSRKYLFQVTNGTSDNYGNNKFYKINFRLSQYTIQEANRQTTEEFEVDFNAIGTKENVLLRKNYIQARRTIEKIYDSLLESYCDRFFDRNSQSFVFSEMGLLDQYLNYFIFENHLNKPFLQYRNSIIISPLIKKYVNFSKYTKLFYTRLSNHKITTLEELRTNIFLDKLPVKSYDFMFFLKNRYSFVFYSDETLYKNQLPAISILNTELNETNSSDNLLFLSKTIELLSSYGEDNNNERIDIIIELLDKITIEYNELFSELQENKPILDYYLIPLMLFSLKQVHLVLDEL